MLLFKTLLLSLLIGGNMLCLDTSTTTSSPAFPQETLEMNAALFRTQGRLDAVFNDFDFDASCTVTHFRLVRVGKRADPLVIENPGSDFSGATRRLMQMARPGDFYFFENIRAQCPGDVATRELVTLAVKIK